MILGGWTQPNTLVKKYVAYDLIPLSEDFAGCYSWLKNAQQLSSEDQPSTEVVTELEADRLRHEAHKRTASPLPERDIPKPKKSVVKRDFGNALFYVSSESQLATLLNACNQDASLLDASCRALILRETLRLEKPPGTSLGKIAYMECPFCEFPHLDEDEWATRRHSTHLCAKCG